MTDHPQPKATRYDTTREAWEDIWDSASVETELDTVRSTRSMETITKYLPYLPTGVPLLEAGSGLSAVVITLRELGYPVIGLDYAVNALEISRQHDASLPLTGGDVHALPFANNSLGAYLSFGVLEHFEHGMGKALSEAYRVLQPGGVLVLTIPYPNLVNRSVALKRRMSGAGRLTNDDFFESTYTRKRLTEAVIAAGFAVASISPTSHSFTLWGIGGAFRASGYYRTSALAERLGRAVRVIAPWPMNYMTLIVGRK